MKVRDIFEDINRLKLPQRVYIFGCGPGGVPFYDRIPQDAYCLALNSAITMDRSFAWWMAFDVGVMKLPWWKTVDTRVARLLFGHVLAADAVREVPPFHIPDYCFRYFPSLALAFRNGVPYKNRPPLMRGFLRGAGTIMGCAIQFLVWARVEEIVLVGCDMQGTGHFDGHINKGHEGVWDVAQRMTWVCKWINKHTKSTVYSLSPTALEIPSIEL